MKHLKRNRKFGRPANQRKALKKGIISSLFLHGKIETTLAKAKEFAPEAEKIITKAKSNNLHSRRILLKLLNSTIVDKLIHEIALNYKSRNGGYTRIIKLGARKSDSAKMAILELVK